MGPGISKKKEETINVQTEFKRSHIRVTSLQTKPTGRHFHTPGPGSHQSVKSKSDLVKARAINGPCSDKNHFGCNL